MRLHLKTVRTLAALAALAALCGGRVVAQVPATGIFVESENFVTPNGNATLGSGPNVTGVVGVDTIAARSGGKSIGFFLSSDWLEYDITLPENGLYDVQYYYASGWPDNYKFGTALSFYTSGQQILQPGAPTTLLNDNPNWGAYTLYTLPTPVALRAGVNRFRLRNRGDYALVGHGGGMNMDYVKFVKTADYPNLVAVTGRVTTTVNGTATPVEGALVSEDPDPTKGALYTEASHLTRTDASGHYTLYLSPGSHQITAFANGHAALTATATAPGTRDFALTWNGRFEAELLDATNPGFGDQNGVQPVYASAIYDANAVPIGSYSANGVVVNVGTTTLNKYAEYRHVVVPKAGVYGLSMHYGSSEAAGVSHHYSWSVNGGAGIQMNWPGTGAYTTLQDSPAIPVTLNAGVNTIRWTDDQAVYFANMDYFALAEVTPPRGTLNVVVKNAGGQPVPGAVINATNGTDSYLNNTDATGSLTLSVAPGAYTVTATKGGATDSTNVNVVDKGTVTANLTLNITALVVEGEDFTASGPDQPGPSVTVTPTAGASGGEVLEGLSGQVNTDVRPSISRYAEWTVDAPADGMYNLTMNYATEFVPAEFTLTVDTTSFRLHYDELPDTPGPAQYLDFAPLEGVPLKKGLNTFRVTTGIGGLNIDYFLFNLDAGTPFPLFKTVTGTVTGTDGTGSAPIRNAYIYAGALVPSDAIYSTTTDAAGHFTLHLPTDGSGDGVGAIAAGYTDSDISFNASPVNFVMQPANLAATNPPTVRIAFTDFFQTNSAVLAVGPGKLSTALSGKELAFVQPGPDTWVDLNVNVPRAGLYAVAVNYGSAWLPLGQSGHLTFAVGGATLTGTIPMTGDYGTHQTIPALVTLPLQAGPNTVRLGFPDVAANISFLDFLRTGNLPPAVSTDIDGSGVTDLRDAVLYARRLAGRDPGPTPDLNNDSASNAADVRRILSVVGGLQ
jgi:hypothetical protein